MIKQVKLCTNWLKKWPWVVGNCLCIVPYDVACQKYNENSLSPLLGGTLELWKVFFRADGVFINWHQGAVCNLKSMSTYHILPI